MELHSKPHRYLCWWYITQYRYTFWSCTTTHTCICADDTLHKMYIHIGAAEQTTQVPVLLIHYTRCIHILELHNKPQKDLCCWYITQDAYTYWSCTINHTGTCVADTLQDAYTNWSCTTNHCTRCIHILELHNKPHMYLWCWYIAQDVYTYWSCTANHTGTCVPDTLHKMYTHWSCTTNHIRTCVADTVH